ncbi:MAG: NTP transferase domain-containing protein [Fimbriimonadaceae bacterium]|nr:NTP transferase domain-containing protein [Fimbriimonadaceae bacterium]
MSEPAPRRIAIVAAAGKGTRFKHDSPKVLADVGGRPCLARVLEAIAAGLGDHEQYVVVGHRADLVRETVGEAPGRHFVEQDPPRGTGHALQCALQAVPLDTAAEVYFFCGDKPLLTASTIARFRQRFAQGDCGMLFLTGWLEGGPEQVRASRQGRVVAVGDEEQRQALAILERRVIDALPGGTTLLLYDGSAHDFTQQQLLAIREVNVSTYAWRLPDLRQRCAELSDRNAQGELLVTDLVEHYLRHGQVVRTMALSDPREGKGIDTVEQWQEIAAP